MKNRENKNGSFNKRTAMSFVKIFTRICGPALAADEGAVKHGGATDVTVGVITLGGRLKKV